MKKGKNPKKLKSVRRSWKRLVLCGRARWDGGGDDLPRATNTITFSLSVTFLFEFMFVLDVVIKYDLLCTVLSS